MSAGLHQGSIYELANRRPKIQTYEPARIVEADAHRCAGRIRHPRIAETGAQGWTGLRQSFSAPGTWHLHLPPQTLLPSVSFRLTATMSTTLELISTNGSSPSQARCRNPATTPSRR